MFFLFSAVSTIYRCRQYETDEHCMVRITLSLDGIYRTNGRQHSHHWDEATEIKRIDAVNEYVSRAGQQQTQLKRIFENVREE